MILHAGKNVENRFWPTKFRGRFLIHAALGMKKNEYVAASEWVQTAFPELQIVLPEFDALIRGGIVGYATIFDVLQPQDVRIGWHMPVQYGFRLTDVKATEFLPLSGRQGFFKAACPLDWARNEGLAPAA
jgi:hypothetical protein